ncbi:PREDICTED: pantetheinase-like [Priapulus caudatus]|uniref:Pantetheinase-like n=1 Tax=Priapulus caudatus TaxID=37621 RepID=A0ABM1EDG3_PRICU|nr:PREDICTED: pantetheinase-like [Priapulus caudatus]XP_014670235.1 PREDICTED: pantetheinase-like [Priapulus caudatus]
MAPIRLQCLRVGSPHRRALVVAAVLLATLQYPSATATARRTSSDDSSCTYTAAVLQYYLQTPGPGSDPSEVMRSNLLAYEEYLMQAAAQGASIIVFPETGITGFLQKDREIVLKWLQEIPEPNTEAALDGQRSSDSPDSCDSGCVATSGDDFVLESLKCMAACHKITIVANLGEVQYCQPAASSTVPTQVQSSAAAEDAVPGCPPDGRFQFNTNVVVDDNGALVVRYRKQHLYNEAAFDDPPVPEAGVFDTPFGRFTTFVCFDINFYNTSADVVLHDGVDSVAMSAAWPIALPTSSPQQTHSGWALGTGVNLLTANVRGVTDGLTFGGSGIYSGVSGNLTYTREDAPMQPELVIADVPCYRKRSWESYAHRPYSVEIYDAPVAAIARPAGGGGSGNKRRMKNKKNSRKRNEHRRRPGNEPNSENSETGDNSPRTGGEREQHTSAPPPKYFKNYVIGVLFNFTALEADIGRASVCYGDLCCHLDYAMSARGRRSDELYALAAFNDYYTAVTDQFWWQVCMVVKCRTSSYKTCGESVTRAKTKFKALTLSGDFWVEFISPSVRVDGDYLLAPLDQWSFDNDGEVMFSTKGIADPLITAEIQAFEPEKHDQSKRGVDVTCTCT